MRPIDTYTNTVRHLRAPACQAWAPMPSRLLVIAVGGVIAIPLIFAALGASQDAGLAFGVVLVVVGIAWMVLGSRGDGGAED